MNESNKKKDELLGEAHGTANAKLRKAILFWLVKDTNRDICFRCGKKIELIDDLSIEHKDSWMSAENPVKSFYDLNNITFSHLKCNIDSRRKNVLKPTLRGENNPNNKLTLTQVNEIKKLLKLGYSIRNIASEYNIGKSEIWKIKNNITWKD